jgi:hypothetical protein
MSLRFFYFYGRDFQMDATWKGGAHHGYAFTAAFSATSSPSKKMRRTVLYLV